MDHLDQIVGPAGPFLRQVDEVLSHAGAPPDHRVWAELRRVRLLPGDAVHAVAALRSGDLLDAAPELRADARAYAGIAAALPPPGSWTGAAADAYDTARRHTAEHLSGGLESLDERLEATADLADALVDWMDQTRGELAGTLAAILGSAEALVLSSHAQPDHPAPSHAPLEPPAPNGPTPGRPAPGQILAAADVAERILQTVADRYEHAADLLHGSAALAEPLHP